MTPSPTQRFIPASPLYRLRLSPCRRLTTLTRPSHPVRHFWPLRNQRFFCSRLRSGLLVERLGIQTRLTPLALAAASFLAEYRVRCHQAWRAGQPGLMDFDGRDQEVRIVGPLIEHLVVGHNLIFGLL
jgi:hypothetical protein